MSGFLVQVWFKPSASSPGEVATGAFHLISLRVADFGAACDVINGSDLIRGELIRTRPDTPGVRVVTKREPVAFYGSAVDRVQVPFWTILEGGA